MSAAALRLEGSGAPSAFRTCPATGRFIHRDAEPLVRVNAVVAIVALLIGATAALLLVLTRWQAVHLLPATWYYRILGVHGMNMLIFFIIYFEMAVLWFTSTVLLNSRPAAPRLGWVSFFLMLVGSLIVEFMQWSGRADVLFTSYQPLRAHPLFYLGIILVAVGALIGVINYFATLYIARRDRTYEGSVP
ncbi:MAG TPA: cbb3-type cytochrome c oxidase subunit I, partial [Gemmatimonadaceae bacterium]|nr:cbb3-type cytochrome c oxidase subunit I [Gemmatimonadaceae bacterium]